MGNGCLFCKILSGLRWAGEVVEGILEEKVRARGREELEWG